MFILYCLIPLRLLQLLYMTVAPSWRPLEAHKMISLRSAVSQKIFSQLDGVSYVFLVFL